MEVTETPTVEVNRTTQVYYSMNRQELLDALAEIVETGNIEEIKDNVDTIRQLFYSKLKQEKEAVQSTVSDSESETETEINEIDPLEVTFKTILAKYREKRTAYNNALEAEMEANCQRKVAVLQKLEELVKSNNDLSETIPVFKNLQAEWKEIGRVAQAKVNDLWKEYNHYQEQFYDLIKINAALREYDFKKNLDIKLSLIEQAEALDKEEDVIAAFRALQSLHDQWRETGPVAKELRDEIWTKFKEASTVINRKHQAYFEALKAQEQEMLKEREDICKSIEEIDLEAIDSYKQWEEKAQEVIAYNDKFKTTTPLERRVNGKIYKRYREACDKFFEAKNNFYRKAKETLQANLEKKRALVEKAEQLKESKEWKATAEKLIALQKEWKAIGPTAKKQSDAIWNKFMAACDYFFEQRNEHLKGKKGSEQGNLEKKLAIIEQIKNYEMTGDDDADFVALKQLSDEFQAVGHIPFKEKDRVYAAYKETADEKFGIIRNNRRANRFDRKENNKGNISRQYERLKQELATYENNMSFFKHGNKKGSSILNEIERKIKAMKEELAFLESRLQGSKDEE